MAKRFAKGDAGEKRTELEEASKNQHFDSLTRQHGKIERSMISSRTKEALARKKSEGKRLGRPKGKLSSVTKLSGKDDLIREYLQKNIPQAVIARLFNVSRLTVRHYIRTRKLQEPAS
jgi:DNA invertase Pin-like site-specific DNA recombinase